MRIILLFLIYSQLGFIQIAFANQKTCLPFADLFDDGYPSQDISRLRLLSVMLETLPRSTHFQRFLQGQGLQALNVNKNEPLMALHLVAKYITELHKENAWDTAIPFVALREFGIDAALSKEGFRPQIIYAENKIYRAISELGFGGEHKVLLVRDQETTDVTVLKAGLSHSKIELTLEEQSLVLEKAGIPTLKIRTMNENYHFVERLNIFGSDVVLEFIRTGASPHLESMIGFYKQLIERSPYFLQDLRPSNLAMRSDGLWVLSDWNLNSLATLTDIRSSLLSDIRNSIVRDVFQLMLKYGKGTDIENHNTVELAYTLLQAGLLDHSQVYFIYSRLNSF